MIAAVLILMMFGGLFNQGQNELNRGIIDGSPRPREKKGNLFANFLLIFLQQLLLKKRVKNFEGTFLYALD